MITEEKELMERDQLIWPSLEKRRRGLPVEAHDTMYGRAFVYFMLFSEPSALEEVGLTGISDLARFYNMYYWFLRFSKLYQAKHGYDAGLEQQAFQLLEGAGSDVDFELLENITTRVTEEVGRIA